MLSSPHPNLFQVTQIAMVRNKLGGVLILKNSDSGKWLLPGGRVRIGETWFEALARELKDATGIVQFELLEVIEVDSWDEHGETFYAAVFACTVPEFEKLILSKEHIEHAWVDSSNLDEFEFERPTTKQRLVRFLGNVPTPTAFRAEY